MRRTFLVAAPVIALLIGGGVYFAMHRGGPARDGARVRMVKVEVVKSTPMADRIEAIGTLQANESVILSAKSQGIIHSLAFGDSQIVKKGDEIATIDAGEQDAQVRIEAANLSQQRRELDRTLELAKEKHVSESRVDELQASVKKAEANVAAANVRANDRRIIAPFSGILGTRRISLGALVSPGTPVATLDDITVMKLDFAVPETFMAALKIGLPIEATASAYPGEIFKGEVASIDSRTDPVTRSVAVRATLRNSELRLRPGMLMVADLMKDQRDALVVSEGAVQPENDKQYVYLVSAEGVATRTEVTIGTRQLGSLKIRAGLKEGDVIVVEGTQDLRSGSKVKIANPEVIPVSKPTQPAEAQDGARRRS